MIHLLFELFRAILGLLTIVLVVQVVLSWLVAFDIVSRRNAFVNTLWEFTSRVTEPLVRPLRAMIPPIANVDLSVMVLLLGLWFVRETSYWLESVLRGGPLL